MSVASGGNNGMKIVTKEWAAIWDAMRDHGDEEASHLLGTLVMKDRFDASRVALEGTIMTHGKKRSSRSPSFRVRSSAQNHP